MTASEELNEIHQKLKIGSYPATLTKDSIFIDFGVDHLKIRKFGTKYITIRTSSDGKGYPVTRHFGTDSDRLLAVVEIIAKEYQGRHNIDSLIDQIEQWMPLETVWNNLKQVEVKFSHQKYTIEYDGSYRISTERRRRETFYSLEEFEEEFKKEVASYIKQSWFPREIKAELLTGEYIVYEGDNLVNSVIASINRVTDSLTESFLCDRD